MPPVTDAQELESGRTDGGAPIAGPPAPATESQQQIRGSFLLLVGRFAAMFVNLLTQVLVVRYLIQADYGAFAFALSAVEVVGYLSTLGLNKACSRFLPIFQERGDRERALGTLVISVTTVLSVSLLAAVGLVAGQEILAEYLVSSKLSLTLLLTLIALAPIEALDFIFEAFFTAFGNVRVVFFRQYVLRPGLKLATIVTVLILEASVQTLAYCYLAAGAIGFIYYLPSFLRVLRQQELVGHSRKPQIRLPLKEVWSFSGPLLTSHLVFLCQGSVAILFLEAMSGNIAVGEFRAVLPFARLNIVSLACFSLLFTPLACRYLSRNQDAQIDGLYWDSVAWVAVMSFPIFALTAVFSDSLTVLMLGDEYASASGVMTLLAVGFFIEAVLGLSGHALRVYARVRYLVVSDLAASLTGIALLSVLTPRYGTIGAAFATVAFMVVGHVLYACFAHFTTDVRPFAPRCLRIYVSTLLAAAGLGIFDKLLRPHWLGVLPLVAVAWLTLVLVNRRDLDVERICPGIARIPLLWRLFSVESSVSLRDTTEVA
jgi:O-antigen/teichoic acid export membrane protein